MGASRSPRFDPSLFRTADEQFQYAQNSLGPAFGRALDLQQRYGPRLLEAVRAGAPEQTQFALAELAAAEQGQLAPGQSRAFQEAFRGAETSRLGALGARQPQGAFSEALGTAELLRNRQLQALGLLRTTGGTEFFDRSVPDIGTALSLEQQRGANLQARLNARAQASNAKSQFNTQLAMGVGLGLLSGGAALGSAGLGASGLIPGAGGGFLSTFLPGAIGGFGAGMGVGGFSGGGTPTYQFNYGQTGRTP